MGFERQKERLTDVEGEISALWGNFTGRAFMFQFKLNQTNVKRLEFSNLCKNKKMRTSIYVRKSLIWRTQIKKLPSQCLT